MFLDALCVSVDLGTTNLLIGIRGEGIVFNEPFVLAVERDSGRIVAFGKEAERVAEKTPKGMTVISPMRRGAVADSFLAQAFLRHSFQECVRGRAVRRPSVIVGTLTCAKDIDRRALVQLLESIGVGAVTFCPESVAAAVGLGLPICEPCGVVLCDVGGGVSEISVLSLGSVVTAVPVPVGGLDLDAAIRKHLRDVYKLTVGNRTAERLKIHSNASGARDKDVAITTRGVNRLTGLPQTLQVSPVEVLQVMTPLFAQISDGLKKALRQISPELTADVVERGIVFCGGGALLDGLRQLVEKEVGIAVTTAEAPLTCVAAGLTSALAEGRPNGRLRQGFVQPFRGWWT